MAIEVYTLKNTMIKTTVDEYLDYLVELKDKKAAVENDKVALKALKQRRTVFVTDSKTAQQAMNIANMIYEGEMDLEDIQFCKVESQHECLCGNLYIPKLLDVLSEHFRISFYVNHQNIVIVNDDGFANTIIQRIISSRTKPAQSREKFIYTFCAEFMENDLEYLNKYTKRIRTIEESILKDEDSQVLDTIAQIRKELLVLREYYDEMRDFGKMLEENENHFFTGKNIEYFGTISDRADRLMGRTIYLLDYVGQLRDTYQGKVAEEQSESMKFLTILTSIFYPLTLVTGWYGMNFTDMPELKGGYKYVIILSALVIIGTIYICKKKKIF